MKGVLAYLWDDKDTGVCEMWLKEGSSEMDGCKVVEAVSLSWCFENPKLLRPSHKQLFQLMK